MNVTKKMTRVHLFSRFPNADLTSRVAFINTSIDAILAGAT